MISIGVHIGHNSSLSVVKNGKVLISVEEERFTRIKNYRGFPYGGLKYLKDRFKIELKDADEIVIAGRGIFDDYSLDVLKERLSTPKKYSIFRKVMKKIVRKSYSVKEKREYFFRFFKKFKVEPQKIVFKEHHLLHAGSAYFQSPFQNSLVVTSDGKGDNISSAVYLVKDGHFTRIQTISSLSSVGQMYSAVTMYLGFKPNRHEGKITGLASFGDPARLADKFLNLFTFDEKAGIYRSKFEDEVRSKTIKEIFNGFKHRAITYRHVMNFPNERNRKYEAIFTLYLKYFDKYFKHESREDIAAGVQFALEAIVTQYIQFWRESTNSEYICLAGGVFANVRLNQKIRELPEVKNVFIQPAMGDSGLSLGGALLSQSRLLRRNVRSIIYDTYKGPEYSSEEIENILNRTSLQYKKFRSFAKQAKEIAKLLADQRVIGFFKGRLEFGPRALGDRSILIDPRDAAVNDIMNKRLNRTEFMPFAPVILDKFAKDYLKGYESNHITAEFMTITYNTYEKKDVEIPAVIHVDKTARPQVIKKEKNPLYYMIIEEFYKITGVPVLINTSFNAHEEPIILSPRDAIKALRNNRVDILSIENFIVYK